MPRVHRNHSVAMERARDVETALKKGILGETKIVKEDVSHIA